MIPTTKSSWLLGWMALTFTSVLACGRPPVLNSAPSAAAPTRDGERAAMAAVSASIDAGAGSIDAGLGESVPTLADGAVPDAGLPPLPVIDTSSAPRPSIQVGDVSLSMEYPKWSATNAGPNLGFDLRYREQDEATWTRTTVEDKGTHWYVAFPQRPEAGTKVRIEATYRFGIPPQLRGLLEQHAHQAARDVLEIVVRAYEESGNDPAAFEQAVEKSAAALDAAIAPVAGFWTVSGETARTEILRALGFELKDASKPDSGWTLKLNKLKALLELEALRDQPTYETISAYRTQLSQVSPTAAEQSCAAVLAQIDVRQSAAGLKIARTCLKLPDQPLSGEVAAALDSFAVDAYTSVAQLDDRFVELLDKLAPTIDGLGKYAATAARYSAAILKVEKAEQLKNSLSASLVANVLELRVALQDVKAVDDLTLSARRSFYDFSTGFVYVGGLDDIVVPTLLSVCPKRCLKSDRGTGDFWNTWQTLSIDFGLKATVIDRHADPRHDGALGFLGGLSYNPIDIVRLSGGAYFFENAQRARWNATYYLGVTFNVLHTGELLGGLGIGSLPKAKLEPAQP